MHFLCFEGRCRETLWLPGVSAGVPLRSIHPSELRPSGAAHKAAAGHAPAEPSGNQTTIFYDDDCLRANLRFARIVFERWRHKASGAALSLSCAACFEQPAGVFAGCVAIRQAKIFTFLQFIARANRRFTPHNCILLARWHQFVVI